MSPERLVHHELCFGCGRTNLFGLLMEVEPVGERRVRGRAFVKQDHQGGQPGLAHEGVIMAALSDAMALASGPEMRASQVDLRIEGTVPVGAFIDVEAEVGEDGLSATAEARVEGRPVASASGTYRRWETPGVGSV